MVLAPAAAQAASLPQVDQLFAGIAKRKGPGIAVLIRRDGKVIHSRGYGLSSIAEGTPVTAASADKRLPQPIVRVPLLLMS